MPTQLSHTAEQNLGEIHVMSDLLSVAVPEHLQVPEADHTLQQADVAVVLVEEQVGVGHAQLPVGIIY